LLETAQLNGYVMKHGKVRGVKRALKTIYSGLSYAKATMQDNLGGTSPLNSIEQQAMRAERASEVD
jgi:DNA-binding NarL/FixJ family response regulator